MPAGRGAGWGAAPRAELGASVVWWRVAMPGLGVGLRLIFSAWRDAVAGAFTGAAEAARAFSRATTSLSMAAVNWTNFWERLEAQAGSEEVDNPAAL